MKKVIPQIKFFKAKTQVERHVEKNLYYKNKIKTVI